MPPREREHHHRASRIYVPCDRISVRPSTWQALVKALGQSSDAEVLVRAAIDAETYAASLRRSRYCPICGGFAPWTPRIPEVRARCRRDASEM